MFFTNFQLYIIFIIQIKNLRSDIMYINFINKVVIDTNAIYCINSYRDG